MGVRPCGTVDDIEVAFVTCGEDWIQSHVLEVRYTVSVIAVKGFVEVSLHFFVSGHVGHFRPVLSNVTEFVAHGHSEALFDAGKGLASVNNGRSCNVDHLGNAAALDWLPVVTLE